MKERVAMFELVEIDRRQFLRLAGGTLVSLSALGLVGCGGAGGGFSHSSSGLSSATGTIQFPTGFSAKLTGLKVSNGHSTAKVGSSMGFQLATSPTNPSLAYVQDSTGAVIFIGFVDPTSKTNVLGPTSTAIALLYFALGAYMMPAGNNAAILALIAADPNVATLAGVIGQRILANTYALHVSDSKLTAGLQSAFGSIIGGSAPIEQLQRGRNSAQLKRPAADPAQLSITGGTQSGIDLNVDPTGATASFTGQNTFRRYARIYVYQTSTTDAAGTQTNLTTPVLVQPPLDVQSTERLNIATALKDIFTHTSPLSPVTTDPVPLSPPTGMVGATFDIIVLGSSGVSVEPAFFSESMYAGEVSTWKADLSTLNLRTAIGDVLFGLILNMVGVTSINALPVNIDAAVASLEKIGESAWQAAVQDAAATATNLMSPVKYAAKMLLSGASGPLTSSQWAQDVWDAYEVLLKGANDAAGAAISEASFSTYLAVGFKVIMGALTGASIVLGTGDLAAVLKDMLHSNQGDLWSATLAIPPIHLTPTSVNVSPGSTTPVSFTVAPPTGATGPFKWTWTLTGGVSAKLTDENGNDGTTLTDISATTVYLLTTSLDIKPMTLKVQGFLVGSSLTPIGSASSSIIPSNLQMSVTPTTSVSLGNQQIFTAVVTGTAPPGALTYKWSLSGPGSLAGGNPVVTAISTVVYTAPTSAGTATLSVQLLDSSQNVLAQASLSIPIITTPSQGSLTITNNYSSSELKGYNGTYVHQLSPAGARTSISKLISRGNGDYFCFLLYYYGYPGGQALGFHTTNGLGGSISNYNVNDALSVTNPGWLFGVPGTGNTSENITGSGSISISNLIDDGTNTSFSFSFNYSNADGTSIGSGTFIVPNAGIILQ